MDSGAQRLGLFSLALPGNKQAGGSEVEHLLIYFPNAYNSHDRAGTTKPGIRSSIQIFNVRGRDLVSQGTC